MLFVDKITRTIHAHGSFFDDRKGRQSRVQKLLKQTGKSITEVRTIWKNFLQMRPSRETLNVAINMIRSDPTSFMRFIQYNKDHDASSREDIAQQQAH